MEITTNNLHQAIAALRQCAKENEKRKTDTGAVCVTNLCNDVADYLCKPIALPILANSFNNGKKEFTDFEDYLRNDLNCYAKMVLEGKPVEELAEYVPLWVNGLMAAAREQIANEWDDTKSECMTFGDAIKALKHGKKVARQGWNGKGMYLWLMPETSVKAEWCKEPHLKTLAEQNGGSIDALGTIRMLTADKKILTGWLASQTDMLSEDWIIVEPEIK